MKERIISALRIFVLLGMLVVVTSKVTAQTVTAPAGDGSVGNPYQIATLNNLYWIADQVNSATDSFSGKYFIQTADIDASATSGWFSGAGWIPIGYATNAGFESYNWFSGIYDGQNHIISNLHINRVIICGVGLFGIIDYATIKNLGLTNVSVTIHGIDAMYTAALVGLTVNNCTVNNCYATGSVTGETGVGGLIGLNGDDTYVANTISYCHANCTVTAATNIAGGLIGSSSNGIVTNCYSSGSVSIGGSFAGGLTSGGTSDISLCYSSANVSGGSGEGYGGLIGYNYGNINNCYSTGSVTSSGSLVGGLIGCHSASLGKIVNHCYSSGTVTGSSSVGGLIGSNTGTPASNVTNCFWDTQTSVQLSSPGGGTGKLTSEMKTQSTFTNATWDFTTVWEIIGTNYPRLKAIPDAALPVELTSFTANASGSSVTLNWQTATEMKNYGFEIEKKPILNLALGEGDFETVGFVQGNGNSNSPKTYSFIDEKATYGKYIYRLKQIDFDGQFEYSDAVEVNIEAPAKFAMMQNFPNPFNPSTIISWQLAAAGYVSLKVYDVLGNEVATLVDEEKPAGVYQVEFDGSKLASGIYFYNLHTSDFSAIKKMILLR